MIREAIDRILDLNRPSSLFLGGREYTSKQVYPVAIPTPKPLVVHTLSGLVDYIAKDIDNTGGQSSVIHVVSPTEVNFLGYYFGANFCERSQYISAMFEPPRIELGDYKSLESFIIALQAYFVWTDPVKDLLGILGNLKSEEVTNFSDDGITQAVTARSGISMAATVQVPNPVILKPYRTFPEIEQPESMFIFRMRRQEKAAPICGLWEADNKQWKIKAINGIADWLNEKLPGKDIIA